MQGRSVELRGVSGFRRGFGEQQRDERVGGGVDVGVELGCLGVSTSPNEALAAAVAESPVIGHNVVRVDT